MTFRIPQDGKISQPNKGDVGGNIFSSLNLDLNTNEGRIRISPRLKVLTKDNDSSITGLGLPIAFATFSHTDASLRTLMVTGLGAFGANGTGRVFMSSDSDFGVFANLANNYANNQPTNISPQSNDAVVWNGNLYVSTNTSGSADIAELAGDTWDADWFTAVLSGTFAGNDPLINMWAGFNGNLHITRGDSIYTVTPAETLITSGAGSIDFGGVLGWSGLYPIWGRASSNRNWISLMTWFGNINSKGDGYIGEWDGTGTSVNKLYKIDAPCALSGCIYKDVLHIIDAYGILKKFNGYGFTEVARLPVANKNIEMPNIYSTQFNNRWIHHRGMEVVNGKINIAVNNFVSTGVYVDDMPSGVWEYDPENPSRGLYHKGSPCADTTDWGQQAVEKAGAIFPLRDTNGNYMVGFSYYTDDASTNRKAVFYDDVSTNTNKRGSFVTPFLSSSGIEDTFQFAHYRHSPIPSGDKIVGKYRTKKSTLFPFTASCTWTSTTTFTSTDSDFANVVGGEEVEPIMGAGASTTAHVSSISNNAGTYTITLDEAIGQASGTFKARVNNWKKMSTLDVTGDTNGRMTIGDDDTKVQIKTEIRATGDFELDDVTIANKSYKKAN